MKALHEQALFRAMSPVPVWDYSCAFLEGSALLTHPSCSLSVSVSQAGVHSPWEIRGKGCPQPQPGFQQQMRGLRRDMIFCLPLSLNSCWRQEGFQPLPNSNLSPSPSPFSDLLLRPVDHVQPTCLPCSFCPWGGVASSRAAPSRDAGRAGNIPWCQGCWAGPARSSHSCEQGRRRSRAAGLACLSPFLLDDPLLTQTQLWAAAGTEHFLQQS